MNRRKQAGGVLDLAGRYVYRGPSGWGLTFYHPRNTLPVSVTGRGCALNCAHCGRRYLTHMAPARDLDRLPDSGPASFLISGGCDLEGRVPLLSNLDTVRSLSRRGRVIVHPGLAGEREAEALAPYVEAVSFDLVVDTPTIRDVYGLPATGDDFIAAFLALRRRIRTVPHLCLGLLGGEIRGEPEALRILSELEVEEAVFLVFNPTPGSRYGDRRPPDLSEVESLLLKARALLPGARLGLGCLRPGGRYRSALDEAALRARLDFIVNPAPSARRAAESRRMEIRIRQECCILD
ncbi:MAG: radical SAM protein [Firmicutes bacterium]|nr:radical SAM protein [Bacillota bacterium]